MDFQEIRTVCVIEHSHDSIKFSETLVGRIPYGCYIKKCKIQILGETNDTSIAENKFYWSSEKLILYDD